jgi:hypothetical protein
MNDHFDSLTKLRSDFQQFSIMQGRSILRDRVGTLLLAGSNRSQEEVRDEQSLSTKQVGLQKCLLTAIVRIYVHEVVSADDNFSSK